MKYIILSFTLLLAACTPMQSQPEVIIREQGVDKQIWEEPMVDVVEVPAGLDPEGTYYRPEHDEVVEVRQGKWRKVEY